MIRIVKDLNTVKYIYNTKNDGVKTLTKPYIKPIIKETTSNDYDYSSIDGKTHYIKSTDGDVYPYECFKETHGYDKGFYFNSILEFPHDQLDSVDFPNYLFYDIETSENSLPVKSTFNGNTYLKAPSTAIVNSIAWITKDGEEYCLIRGRDGSEFDILDEFVNYLESNDISCLISHNGANFDDIIMRDRLLNHSLNHELFSKTKNQLNLDTLKLAQLLNIVPKTKMISLNDLASELGLDMQKDDLEVLNPITAYNESIKNNDYTKFESYNIQDVAICKSCFERMGAKDVLMELFKQTLAPFSKFNSNVALLNHYTCNKLLNDGFVVPKINNPTLQTKNEGGYNFIKESDKLLKYNSVVAYDIVSYYPSLFMLVGADSNGAYDNFNTTTGELSLFNDDLHKGALSEIAEDLFNSRIETKKLMKSENDELKKSQLNNKQLTQKILVNSLYGACDSSYDYILGSHKVSTMITAIGRDLLKAVIDEFGACYGKTDSIFISNVSNPDETLLEINNFVTNYLKDRFNLNNIRDDGSSIIKFEIDSILKSLIVKSANEYIKIYDDGIIKLKGGSFKGDNKSDFEADLIQFVLSDDDFNIDKVFKFCESVIKDKPLNYFSKKQKLSSKTPNSALCLGRKYMEDNNIPYSWDFKYNAVRVDSDKYDWVLYPNGVNVTDLKVSRYYVYIIAIMYLKTNKLISKKKQQSLFKDKDLLDDGVSINKYNDIKKDQLDNQHKHEVLDVDIDTDSLKCIKLQELCSLIKDTKEYITNDIIKIIPHDDKRKPKYKILQKYLGVSKFNNIQHRSLVPSGVLCDVDDNVGIILNYKNLHVLDIDGAKGLLSKNDNKKLCKYLKDLLVNTGIKFIIQSTKSGGYHLLFVGDNNFNFKGFKYPNDFFIEELQGQDMGISTIEVINNKPLPLAPTSTADGEYKFLSNDYTWESIFNNPSDNTFEKVHDVFTSNGFIYEKPKVKEYNKNYTNNELVDLTTDELGSFVNACIGLYQIADKKNFKNDLTLAIGGICSRYITENCADVICDNIHDHVGYLFKDSNTYYNSFKQNYENDDVNKTGIPTIAKGLKDGSDIDNDVDEYLQTISFIVTKKIPTDTEIGGFKQNYQGLKFKTKDGDKTIGYFNITNITIINGFNPLTQDIEVEKQVKYDIEITNNRYKDKTFLYNGITLNQLYTILYNLNLVAIDEKPFINKMISFIQQCKNKGYIKETIKPYPVGVYCYKNEIMLNLPYLNDGTTSLNDGLDVLRIIVKDIFLNKPKHIVVLNNIMLMMLNSVFKSLNLANGVNKATISCGTGKTLKTFSILAGIALFDSTTRMMESSGGDSVSAVQRQASLDTLPLDIHDSGLKISDSKTKNMIKSMLYGYVSQVLAESTYGNDVNSRYSYRSLAISTNDAASSLEIDKNDGEDRRLNVIPHDESDIVTKQQDNYIHKILNVDKDNAPHLLINRISIIGYYWLNYIIENIKPYDMTDEFRSEIIDSQGFNLISGFWDYINELTNSNYNDIIELLKNEYEYPDVTVDRGSEVVEILRADFYNVIKSKDYNNDSIINDWIKSSPLFKTSISDDIDYVDKIAIISTEFNKLVKPINTNKDHKYLFKTLFEDVNVDIDDITFRRRNLKHYDLSDGKLYALIDRNLIKSCLLGV